MYASHLSHPTAAAAAYVFHPPSGTELEPSAPQIRHGTRQPAGREACTAKVMRFSQEHVQQSDLTLYRARSLITFPLPARARNTTDIINMRNSKRLGMHGNRCINPSMLGVRLTDESKRTSQSCCLSLLYNVSQKIPPDDL